MHVFPVDSDLHFSQTSFKYSFNYWLYSYLAVVQHAYELANAAQKQELLIELYSKELQLFQDLVSMKERR